MMFVPIASRALAMRSRLSTPVRWLVEHPWMVMISFSAVLNLVWSIHSNYTWHYVVTGTRFLFAGAGLHLYAAHPELQMGPLTFVAAAPFILLLPVGLAHVLIIAGMAGTGIVTYRLIQSMIGENWIVPPFTFLAVGGLFTAVWAELSARWGHPDDAAAVLLTVAAVVLLRRQHAGWMALSLAAAVDFKPWAVAAVPLVLAAHRSTWLRSIAIIVAGVAAAWLPFFLADHQTLRALRFSIPNVADSALRVLGVHDASTPPWLRTVQLGLALLLAGLLALRGQWASVLLGVVATRMLFDPATKGYYTAGLIAATALLDLVELGRRAWLTYAATLFLFIPNYILGTYPVLRGILRAAVLLSMIAYVCYRAVTSRGLTHRTRSSDTGNIATRQPGRIPEF